MSIAHLKELRAALSKRKWHIHEELPGDDYKISAIWVITRPNGDNRSEIAFEGRCELHCLPIEQAYGCHLVANPDINLYFGDLKKSFPDSLRSFTEDLSSEYT